MKPRPLSLEERAIVNPKEQVLFEIINGFTELELSYFDDYRPSDLKHYMTLQRRWVEEEKYLLSKKLKREPTEDELLGDMNVHHNPTRFRAWYLLQFPYKMERTQDAIEKGEEQESN